MLIVRTGEFVVVNLYAVIGEHGTDPDRLLVIGEDGQHYAWELSTDQTVPVEVDDGWKIDPGLAIQDLFVEEQMGL